MTIRFVTPVVFNKLIKVRCINLSNTTLFDGRDISSIYYIRYSYMFRRLTMTILRLYMGYLLLYVYLSRYATYPHLPTSMTHTRSRAHLNSYLPTVYNPY